MALDVESYCSSAAVLDYFRHIAGSFPCGLNPHHQAPASAKFSTIRVHSRESVQFSH